MPHWRVLELPVVRDRRARYLNPRSLRRRMSRVLAALAITLVHVGSRGHSGHGRLGRALRLLTPIGHRSRSSGQLEVSTLSRPKLRPEIDLIATPEFV